MLMINLLCLFGMIAQLAVGQNSLHLECGKNLVFDPEAGRCRSKKTRSQQTSCPYGFTRNNLGQCERIPYNAGK